jgi:hypothetical protein
MRILVLIAAIGAVHNYITDNFDMWCRIDLVGEAKGGVLSLVCEQSGMEYEICSIKTTPSQSGAEVAKLLVEALHASPVPDFKIVVCDGAKIYLTFDPYYFTGSETGFAVPTPLRFITVNYLPKVDQLTFNWIPDEQEAYVVTGGSGGDVVPARAGVATFDKFASRAHVDMRTGASVIPNPQDLAFLIAKVRSPFIPTTDLAPRFVRIHVCGTRQEDLDNVPFYGNVGPNWEAWCPAGFQEGDLRLYQGEKSEVPEKDRSLAFASSPDAKFYCQMFEIRNGVPAEGGIYRRYLGLIPGHSYRAYARFNTFEAKAEAGDWSISFHACADPPGQGLAVGQLAGRDALPNGATGPDAARIVIFKNGGETTEGKWVKVATGMQGGQPSGSDITIPEGSTSLSAWVRVKGSTSSRLGMDWSALEDVTPPTFTLTDG